MKAETLASFKSTINNRYLRQDQMTLVASELPHRLVDDGHHLRPYLIAFFRALAICHSVLADSRELEKPYVIDYKAESPDEAALVAAARDAGFPFINRTTKCIDIEILGKPEKWTPLRVLEFDSSRKRMNLNGGGLTEYAEPLDFSESSDWWKR